MHLLPLSVRDFIEPLVPTGSIDASYAFQLQEDTAQQGIRMHARIQKRMASEHPQLCHEVPLFTRFQREGLEVLVRGRIDLLIDNIIEEIKTTTQAPGLLKRLAEDPLHPFAQQARMYAWMHFGTEHPCTCRIRVVSLLDDSESLVEVPFDPEAFGHWVEAQVDSLHRAHLADLARAEVRRGMAKGLTWPFPETRSGQGTLMDEVALALEAGEPLLLQAPTGLGKTAGVLHPALLQALREHQRVFCLTPRNSQHPLAEAYVRRLREQGHPVRSVTLRAKEKVCPQEEVHCRPESCPRADSYFDRLHACGVLEELQALGCADGEALREAADRHTLCPFELSLDAARHADVIIGDYNYALAPGSTLLRFFGNPEAAARNILLLDEAHNLPSRAADWFSPALELEQLLDLRKRRKGLGRGTSAQLTRCIRLLEGHQGPHRVLEVDTEAFLDEEQRIRRLLAKAAAEGQDLPPSHPLVRLLRPWAEFCAVLRERTEAHLITWKPRPGGGTLQITCLEASEHLAERFKAVAGTVLFSATLKPFDYYRRLSGLPEGTRSREIPSPFPAAHRKVLIVPQISTRLRLRERSAPRIAQFLSRVLPLRPGNYIVFFPSFAFLEQTLAQVELPGFEVLSQPRQADQATLRGLLDTLQTRRKVVLLAVQGGSLSEGVDLPGEALIGCVVVGPPIPPFSLEHQQLRAHFQKRYGQGEAYASTYPAMAKAIQAAGRVIRGPQERGLLVFLDDRFLEPDFAAGFPSDWFSSPRELVSSAILADVQGFWEAP
nr:ATP-dependent DNA helicase [uncultured Holophaga sp.]